MYNAKNKIGRPFFENMIFYRLATDCCPIENVQEIWLTKMDFGQTNAETGQKMANGRLLFLALIAKT